MVWYNHYFLDLFLFNTVLIGLAYFSAFFTKRYGVFSVQTIVSLVGLYTGYLLFMVSNPYYDREIFDTLFMLAPVIIVRVYYDIRLTYIFILFIIFASQMHNFIHSTSVDYSLGLLYIVLSAIIALIPLLKNKTMHTFILFSVSYLATILTIYIWPPKDFGNIGLESILWGLNIFTLTFIASKIVPELLEYIEMTYSKKDLEIDALTGVYNRLSFNQHMDMLFLKERNNNISAFSMLFFDMNKYKEINDIYGHHVGDHVLKVFAKQLETKLHEDEKVFRYGGDEFVVYTPRTGNRLKELIIKLEEDLQGKSHKIEENHIVTRFSIGVSEYQKDTSKVLEMVKIADRHMFMNKRSTSF